MLTSAFRLQTFVYGPARPLFTRYQQLYFFIFIFMHLTLVLVIFSMLYVWVCAIAHVKSCARLRGYACVSGVMNICPIRLFSTIYTHYLAFSRFTFSSFLSIIAICCYLFPFFFSRHAIYFFNFWAFFFVLIYLGYFIYLHLAIITFYYLVWWYLVYLKH